MTIKGILFDLDGTLLNTNELIIDSFQYTLKKVLNLDITKEEIVPFFGEPLRDTLYKFSAEKVDILVKTYREYNRLKHDELTKIFPGVIETIQELKRQGFLLAVVTSKKNSSAQHGLELFDIKKYFNCFVGFDDTENHKPKAEPALKAIKKLGIKPKEALMVGDSPYDILCGKNAGTFTAVVKYSEHSLSKLLKYNPDYVLENLKDLLNILNPRENFNKKTG